MNLPETSRRSLLKLGAAAVPALALGAALPVSARAATSPTAGGGGGIHCSTQSQPVVPPAG
ncbi:hypothetical protein [Kitasatospora sp. NPDC059571]|uniref:hypothetical protein n=1 Tax=Kitasatospora sp. NPDC059571 TaxID=3346871 RepID=UPI0036BA4D9F